MAVLVDPESGKKKKIVMILIVLLCTIVGIAVGVSLSRGKSTKQGVIEVDWTTFKELDLNTGMPSQKLKALDGKRVRAPGFMVPLEDNRAEVTEYLLVPNPQACIHAPPPPSNQMIYVRMVQGPAKMIFGPVWVEGTLRVASQIHQYGNAGFQIYGEITEAYK
jgi:uncharacterized protein